MTLPIPDSEAVRKRWISIFYTLLRDQVHPSDMEKIIREDNQHLWDQTYNKEAGKALDNEVVYSNPYIRDYAEDFVNRVFGTQPTKVKQGYHGPRKM